MKSYTGIEQSKKLAKILPLESADMTLCYNNSIKGVNYTNQFFANLRPVKEAIEKDFSIWYDEIGYGVNTVLPDITMEEPVDACVGVILELHELNLL